jgi:hypothetical protein
MAMTIVKRSDIGSGATHRQEGVAVRLGSGDPNCIVRFRKPGATLKLVLKDAPNSSLSGDTAYQVSSQ